MSFLDKFKNITEVAKYKVQDLKIDAELKLDEIKDRVINISLTNDSENSTYKNNDETEGTSISELESTVATLLKEKKYQEAIFSIEYLRHINLEKNYDELYIVAKTGNYEFKEVEKLLNDLKKRDVENFLKLTKNLDFFKNIAYEVIREATSNNDFTVFMIHPELKYLKDSWGMTPLMYYVLKKDMIGIEFLADTFVPNDQNILGHTTFNLICRDIEDDDFIFNAFKILDQKLIELLKNLKSKTNRNKLGGAFIKGIDKINNNFGSTEVMEITSSIEDSMNNSINSLVKEINLYVKSESDKNKKEFIECLLNPNTPKKELDKQLEIQKKLEKEQKNLSEIISIYTNVPFKLNDTELEKVLNQAVYFEIDEKDEFETTSEYNLRLKETYESIKMNYLKNETIVHYIESKVNKIKEQIRENENILINNTKKIEEIKNILENNFFDVDSILYIYYEHYEKMIEIGSYNADEESFFCTVDGVDKSIKVNRKIAKDFKLQFDSLSPKYKSEIKKESINHVFIYEINKMEVELKFLTTSNSM